MNDFSNCCLSKIMQSALNKNCFRSFTCRCLVSNKSILLFSLKDSYVQKHFIWRKMLYSPSLTRRHSKPAQRLQPSRYFLTVFAFEWLLMSECNYSRKSLCHENHSVKLFMALGPFKRSKSCVFCVFCIRSPKC